jgi:hypothetical protein
MKITSVIMVIIFAIFLVSCEKNTVSPQENPKWVQGLITQFQNTPVGNPPQSIWQYEYNGKIVYYIPPQCCDQPSVLLSEDSTVICAPDGGLSGQGDGKCGDFFQVRKNEKLIWKDPRP